MQYSVHAVPDMISTPKRKGENKETKTIEGVRTVDVSGTVEEPPERRGIRH
ncbi:Hermansky-Pudlak syndrome 5 protein [Platysternon megacephalum]|uniref:Hermansky-Pudlak syndrome 5 protein n=1 Tax=Platysternon megacephalum TaxID=55544 RepID=A0A4D9EK91_9SAUR|nr:Hermansky-Pudlak syndrome 5 protein [Platysternon megacephalum]